MAKPRDFPGMTRFQRENLGQPVTGWSGIVPFYRTKQGEIKSPVGPTGTAFKKK